MSEGKKAGLLSQHKILMLICCAVPILFLVYFLTSSASLGSSTWLIFLLCPLMHVAMMWGMRGKKDH